jgi:purine catabolism regulator
VIRRDVVLLDRPWGHLAVLPPAKHDDPLAAAACAYGAEALSLALLRSAAGADLQVRRRQLVDDLTERRWHTPQEVVARARVLGLPVTAEGRYTALVLTDLGEVDLSSVARAVVGALAPGTALVADVGEDVVAVIRTSAVIAAGRAVLRAADGLGATRSRVVAGTVVSRLEDVDRSIARARASLPLTAGGERVVSAAGMTAALLLAGVRDGQLARQLVHEQLGALTDHDAAHGTELVTTLRVYLANSSSKVRTAQVLRVRRQTLYGRLQRIEELIGAFFEEKRHTALVLALAIEELTPGERVPGPRRGAPPSGRAGRGAAP